MKHSSICPGRPAEETFHEKVTMTVSRDRRFLTDDGTVQWIPAVANVVFAQGRAVTSLDLAATWNGDRAVSKRFCLRQEIGEVSRANRETLHKGTNAAHSGAKRSLGG